MSSFGSNAFGILIGAFGAMGVGELTPLEIKKSPPEIPEIKNSVNIPTITGGTPFFFWGMDTSSSIGISGVVTSVGDCGGRGVGCQGDVAV
jgi:hypothetical protein